MFRPIIAALLAALATTAEARAESDAPVRRFALVVGVNSGGPSRTPLRYATSDAASFAQLLSALGGVNDDDRVILVDPDRAGFDGAVTSLARRMSAGAQASRVELIVYFSGHSDETGLMLGTDKLGYDAFRAALATLPADVRIAIVDSCQSGALTRRKGGAMRPPFLLDTSTKVRGQAILTSSSETEAAQESDRIRGSFFTHYLMTGLRGAADVTRDRRVTLNEAYQFAFAETLARTEGTQFGPQHPAYEIALSGTGDVVMTDLRATSASVTIDEALAGRVFLRDRNDQLIAELYKLEGRAVEIGLPPGTYKVRIEKAGEVLEGAVQVGERASAQVTRSGLGRTQLEVAQRRGDAEASAAHEVSVAAPPKRRVHRLLSLGLVPGLELPPPPDDAEVVKNLSYDLIYGSTDHLRGLAIASGATRATRSMRGVQLSSVLNMSDGDGTGLQLAIIANISKGPFTGIQVSTLGQRNQGELTGLQVATGANWNNNHVSGLQLAAGANIAHDMRGVQLSAGVNTAHAARGLQLTGGVNVARELRGVQVAMVNVAGDTTGLQLSLLNVGGDVTGLQLGLINVAQVVHGAQVGLVNVSKSMHGVPLGLFSYIRDRGLGVEVGVSVSQPLNLALRYDGGHRFYGYLGGGMFDFQDLGNGSVYLGVGLGARLFNVKDVTIEADILAARPTLGFSDRATDFLVRERIHAVFPLDEDLALFAGLSWFQYMGWNNRDNVAAPGTTVWDTTHKSGDFTLRTWPTFHAGLRI